MRGTYAFNLTGRGARYRVVVLYLAACVSSCSDLSSLYQFIAPSPGGITMKQKRTISVSTMISYDETAGCYLAHCPTLNLKMRIIGSLGLRGLSPRL